ncbi:MAG: GNAT family N-acetyltransferase [Clostridiaceae bacterium]|nr:GNAT family N-acetyltransferase [Clostridiaceae bacterium]
MSIVWQMNNNAEYLSELKSSDLSIRPAMHWEVQDILRLLRSAMVTYRTLGQIPEDRLDISTETSRDVLKAIKSGFVFVAVDPNDQILATARLRFMPLNRMHPVSLVNFPQLSAQEQVAYFTRFAVDQRFRGIGIGSKMLDTCEKIARDEGLRAIVLHTAISNESVAGFYLRRGYTTDSVDLSRGYPRGFFVKIL